MNTHHLALDKLGHRFQELHIDAKVERGARYIHSGKVICTAGVSTGIDGAFYLLNMLEGNDLANKTEKIMEYNCTKNWVKEINITEYKNLKY